MPRDRDDDGDDYLPFPQQHKGTNPTLIIALVVGGVLLLGVLVCGGLIAMFAWRTGPQAADQPAPAVEEQAADPAALGPTRAGRKEGTNRTYTRDEFKTLVMGKTEAEVIAAVGRPDSSSQDGDRIKWTYRKRTIDPATGQVDAAIFVQFTDGKVSNVD